MTTLKRKRLDALFQEFEKRRLIVLGDLMLDRYLWGNVSRISPEAPVPVVDIESESVRFGGAANVAYNVKSLGVDVVPAGVVGMDEDAAVLRGLFEENGMPADGLFVDEQRPTTVKTRIIAHNQHVVRTDREVRRGLPEKIRKKLQLFIASQIENSDGIILEDYNKGLLGSETIQSVIQMANAGGKMIFVDPKFDHFFKYKGVTLFKPNRKEVANRLGSRLDTDEMLGRIGTHLLERLECQALLITLGDEGLALFQPGKAWIKLPTRAVKVHDVSGAGDTVIATMAVAMTSGAIPEEAAAMANLAAGIVCGEVGIMPINRARLYEALVSDSS